MSGTLRAYVCEKKEGKKVNEGVRKFFVLLQGLPNLVIL